MLSLAIVVLLLGSTGCGKPDDPTPAVPTTATVAAFDPVKSVQKLLTGIGTGDPAAASDVDPVDFVQHDLSLANGANGFRDYLASLPPKTVKFTPVRCFRDGDFVVAQSSIESATPGVAFDVFRFRGSKMIEHWNNTCDRPADPNASGHTMTDGPTAVTDDAQTEANKSLAKRFVDEVLIGQKLGGFDSFFDNGNYVQHDPRGIDGTAGLKKAIGDLTEQGAVTGYGKVQRVLGQGNFVLVITAGTAVDKPSSFYDLFRVQNAKLAEHWAVVQQIPAREDWKNDNGKF